MTSRCSDVGPISPAKVAISLGRPSLYKNGTNTTRIKNRNQNKSLFTFVCWQFCREVVGSPLWVMVNLKHEKYFWELSNGSKLVDSDFPCITASLSILLKNKVFN